MILRKQFTAHEDGYSNIEYNNHDQKVFNFVNTLQRKQIISITDHAYVVVCNGWYKETNIWYEV